MLYWNGTSWIQLNPGLPGQHLTLSLEGTPIWTGPTYPQVITAAINSITSYTARIGGSVVSDGGAPISIAGVVCSTWDNPTLSSNILSFSAQSPGLGNFSGTTTGLFPATTYKCRAYAGNSVGIRYGEQQSFTTYPLAAISNLNCAGATFSTELVAGKSSEGTLVTIPYTGGNGGSYPGLTVNSTGLSGLTASLLPGTLLLGSGNLEFTLAGTSPTVGTASFSFQIGGQSCTFTNAVVAGAVEALDCSTPVHSGSLTNGGEASAVSITIPYTGGNGGNHPGQIVSSDGVTGLTATLSLGNFANGSGSLTYWITGTAIDTGIATFAIAIGGQNCVLRRKIHAECGAYIAPNVWKKFMCHNLGSANPDIDPYSPGWEIHGGHWQWGTKEMGAPGPSGPETDQANIRPMGSWKTNIPDGAWSHLVKTANDPCPPGYRVPTYVQWQGVLAHNPITNVGNSWNSPSATNYSTGKQLGSKLFLPASGRRSIFDSRLYDRGNSGWYWSSSEYPNFGAWFLWFDQDVTRVSNSEYYRTNMLSVRCISE